MLGPDFLIRIVDNAIAGIGSSLDERALGAQGMTSLKIRHFLNAACAGLGEHCRYLEVGTFRGSTAISASYRNRGSFTTIDNFGEFPKADAKRDLGGILTSFADACNIDFIEGDCWEVASRLHGRRYNAYLYDGNHGPVSQAKALTKFIDCLDDVFIFAVDDFNAAQVEKGTRLGMKTTGVTTHREWVMRTDKRDSDGWHNGFFVAVLEKAKHGD